MNKNDTLSAGIIDESLLSGTNDNEDGFEDFDEEENFDEENPNKKSKKEVDEDKEEDEDDQEEDGEDNSKPKDKLQRLYKTTNLQNKQIRDLKKQLRQLQNSKKAAVSEEDLEKIKEKYNEEDLGIIEKIIEKKATELMDTRQSKSLEQREVNIFLKKYPEISDAEFKHARDMQKNYGYSLDKAYRIIKGGVVNDRQPSKHNVSGTFQSGNSGKSKDTDSAAFKDMDAFL